MDAEKIAKRVTEEVNLILFDKSIDRKTCIEALEIAREDLDSVIDSLKDDERRATR